MKNISIEEFLKKTSQAQDFFFSYNSHIIPKDSLISFPAYSGNISGALLKALGPKYEFIETPGYIVIRYAPNKLYLDEGIDSQQGNSWLITGQIRDLGSDELIAYASVYERSMLAASMTDKNGYFELKLKNPDKSVLLTISKEHYRDTTFMLLPPFDIAAKRKNPKYKFYPTAENGERVEETYLGRMFTGFKQRMQGLNIGGFFAEVPVQVSLVPAVSTHGMMNNQTVNNASINIFGGYSGGVNGVELAGLFNINRKNVDYLQVAGLFNLVGGNTKGVQLAGLANIVLENSSGFQASGLFNTSENVKGFQLAGLINQSKSLEGWQIAGLSNHSSEEAGTQLSGLVNKGKNVTGWQITSLLNVADSSNYPIAFINLIKSGEKTISLSFDESQVLQVIFRSGGTYTYGLLGLGNSLLANSNSLVFDAGLGYHLIKTKTFHTNTELVSRSSIGPHGKNYFSFSIKLLPALNLGQSFRFYMGPSINYGSYENVNWKVPGWEIQREPRDDGFHAIFCGLGAGIQIIL
ncbi:carboxypeptidase-like regulatory domain-containing protein [Echinicola marina]|uniref:carboxypeptidase-like regulatory domain-containing protein n=1 Tax=Echinicola marina TaxID=2859768 RepID=UPI001CF6C6C2|nr:carboxypeptidase-like regulatory domain-containing protein [Echinicola marina]UCS92376.1 carboxypeptidase-like regulatory domain-containing protein [Echinicola marina]